ncbi:MAG: TetR/AcrR family transcriptional regulator [Erysipelotrichaceae bacterium]|nr:TetR/AcrR family transcriptional regulator [Erysipelotrichaceae bacterium]
MARRDLEKLIQETALELFKEKGFEAVTVLEICQKCQITKPTFYKFASSKGSLLIHYYADLLIIHQPGWDDRKLHGSWGQCIIDTMDFYLNAMTDNGPDLVTRLFIHNFDVGDQSLFVYRDELIQSLVDVINYAKEEGTVTSRQDTRVLALALVDLICGAVANWSASNGDFDIKQWYMSMLKSTLGYRKLEDLPNA